MENKDSNDNLNFISFYGQTFNLIIRPRLKTMSDYIMFIIVGLVLDIFGAILIVRPILYFKGIWTGKFIDFVQKQNSDDKPNIVRKRIKMAWVGVAFLVVGFSLQIWGNYVQHLPMNH